LLTVACADTNDTNDENNNDVNNGNETNNENDENNVNETNDENNINENDDTNETSDADYEPIEPEEVADVFLNGEYDRLYNQTSEAFQAEITAEQLQEIGEEFNEDVENYVIQSDLVLDDNMTQFTWTDEVETKG